MMVSMFYNSAKLALWTGAINLAADPIFMMLLDGTYAPSQAHQVKSDVTGEIASSLPQPIEPSGVAPPTPVSTGYTAGGRQLAGQSATIDAVGDRVVFRAEMVTWPESTFTASGFVLYKKGATDAASPLLGCYPFGEAKGVVNMDFDVACDATEGFMYF